MRIPRSAAPLLSVVIAVTIAAAGLLGPSYVRAGAESDIPGVPLQGTVVTGRLGGPIYDVVYRLSVPPASVIVADLSGTPDTDFDLYLYDSSATTVLTTAGVVARSTDPASDESISYPTRGGGTYYLDLNGASDAEGEYRLTVQIVPDPTPPGAQVVIDKGAAVSSSTTVEVIVIGWDDLSGVPEVALSADGTHFEAWQQQPLTTTWQFPADGVWRLWAKARNGVGLESAVVMTQIRIDTVPPAVVSASPAVGAIVTTARPVMRITFSEPIQPTSWTDGALVVQSAHGQRLDGTYRYESASRSGIFTPSSDLVPGVLYFATVAGARDLAGNVLERGPSWWFKHMTATSVTLAAAPSTVVYGSPVTLSGTATPAGSMTVYLQMRPAGDDRFQPVRALSAAAARFAVAAVPPASGVFRAYVPETTTMLSAASREIPVTVRRWVALRGPGPAVTRTQGAGDPTTIRALVRPEEAGIVVSFRLYRWDARAAQWRFVSSRGTRTLSDGQAQTTWIPSAGRWAWQAVAFGTSTLAEGRSSLYRWSVTP